MALAWLSAGSPELLQHIYGELSETCTTEYKANVFALEKAKNWIDQPIRLKLTLPDPEKSVCASHNLLGCLPEVPGAEVRV
jgi:hypothetical protein